MERAAKRLVGAMISHGIIDPLMREQYVYSLEMIAEKIVSVIMVLITGICMGKLFQAVVFAAFFLALRTYTGGYHAGKFIVCFIESTGMMLMVLCFGDLLIPYAGAVIILLIISIIVIMINGTVNHPNMNYDYSELKEASKGARYVLLIEVFIIAALGLIGASGSYLVYMSLGVILCAISLLIAKIMKQEVAL